MGTPQATSHVPRSEEHTSELQSPCNLVCRLLLERKKPYPALARRYCRLSTHPTPPYPHTLPLHDALPICFPGAPPVAKGETCPGYPDLTHLAVRQCGKCFRIRNPDGMTWYGHSAGDQPCS